MRKFGLIGKSLQHSFSPDYFTKKFKSENIEAVYECYELESIVDIQTLLQRDIAGLNVTIPYKKEVIPFLDDLAPSAEAVGAVNTIVFEGGQTIGHNTDITGFRNSIKPFLKHGQERALILGTGGASLAVAFVLKRMGLEVFYLSRQPESDHEYAYEACNAQMIESCKVIVNTTPLGTAPEVDECPDIPYQYLTGAHLCYDLIYNPAETVFLRRAKEQGATTVNGLSMLKIQAEASWDLWNAEA